MSKQASATPPQRDKATASDAAIASKLVTIGHVLRESGTGRALLWLVLGLVVVIGATAYGQIELNAWNQPFYDSIDRRDIRAFGIELGVYAVIAGGLLVLNVAQMWLNQMVKLKLRQGLTGDLLAQWLAPKRAFMLADAGAVSVNPDQRIQEDARRFTELSADLGIGLFQASLLLASFIGVLWTLSAGVAFEWQGKSFSIPGYMVWAALFYAGAASLVTWRVGRPLIAMNAERYVRESDLRFSLVRVNENSDGVAIYRSERQEQDRLKIDFDRLLVILRQLVGATTRLTWLTAGYGWFTIVAPVVVAAPAYFAGNLTFGGLLMAVGAFTQVQQSLRWFVDNATLLADWQATLVRVEEFRKALLDIDSIAENKTRIEVLAADNHIVLDEVSISLPSGHSRLSEPRVEVNPGERVVIIGGPNSGKTSLFHAMAGLWPWGTGRIELPTASVMFMPKHPYFPRGALRELLAYPASPDTFQEGDFIAALTRMGLKHLAPALDKLAQWEKELTAPELQSLAFARLLLHKPRWVVVDTAIDTFANEARSVLFDIFKNELASSSLLAISGIEETYGFYDHLLKLTFEAEGKAHVP